MASALFLIYVIISFAMVWVSIPLAIVMLGLAFLIGDELFTESPD